MKTENNDGLSAELERFRIAYHTNLAKHIEPMSAKAIRQGEALVAAARFIIDKFDQVNGLECKRGCGQCARCLLLKALDLPLPGVHHI